MVNRKILVGVGVAAIVGLVIGGIAEEAGFGLSATCGPVSVVGTTDSPSHSAATLTATPTTPTGVPDVKAVDGTTLELSRCLPTRPANGKVILQIPVLQGSPTTLHAFAGNVSHRDSKRIVAAGKAEARLMPPQGGILPLEMTLSGLPTGSFDVPVRLSDGSASEFRFAINVSVVDGPAAPWFVILLGVILSAGIKFLNERYAPRQGLLARVVPLRSDLERWRREASDEKEGGAITAALDKIDTITTRSESQGIETLEKELAAIERDVGQMRIARSKRTVGLRHKIDDGRQELLEHTGQTAGTAGKDAIQSIAAKFDQAEIALDLNRLREAEECLNQALTHLLNAKKAWSKQLITALSRAVAEPEFEQLSPEAKKKSKEALQLAENLQANGKLEAAMDVVSPAIQIITASSMEATDLRAIMQGSAGRSPEIDLLIIPSEGIVVGQPVRLSLPSPLDPGASVDWHFGDTEFQIQSKLASTSHLYREPGDYTAEAIVLASSGSPMVFRKRFHVGLDSSAITVQLLRKRRTKALLISTGVAMLIASISGLQLIYVGKPFGTLADYIVALLWGFGTEQAVSQVGGGKSRRTQSV